MKEVKEKDEQLGIRNADPQCDFQRIMALETEIKIKDNEIRGITNPLQSKLEELEG